MQTVTKKEKLLPIFSNKNVDMKKEMLAGLTTFLTMAYIIAVNPSILSATGMPAGALVTATCLAAAIACILMGIFANLPFALASGMGLNAYFAYTVVGQMGISWKVALTAVFVEGLVFIVLSLTNVRQAIFDAIPKNLKIAVSVGIGFFIAFIGMQNAHIIVDGATLVSLFSLKSSIAAGTFTSEGITVLLALVGTLIMAFLLIKGVKGYMLFGIVITWVLGIICELTGVYVPNPAAGFYSLLPSGLFAMPASIAPTFLKFDFGFVTSHLLDFVTVTFAFLFVDIFDTLGTVIGCATKANMLDKDGKLPKIQEILLADAVGTLCGSCVGTSTITTFVESSSGINEGGRTGLTSCTTGVMFLVALFLWPLFSAIPSFATAPALIIVGFLMMQQVTSIDWLDLTKAIPCFITIATMGFAYSISEGISFGIISYVVLHVLNGKSKEVSPLMYVLAVVFVLKYFLI